MLRVLGLKGCDEVNGLGEGEGIGERFAGNGERFAGNGERFAGSEAGRPSGLVSVWILNGVRC